MKKPSLNLTVIQRFKFSFFVLIFSFLVFSSLPFTVFSQDETDETVDNHAHEEDVKRGERFFMGLLPKDRKFDACVSCHVLTTHSDTMDWNPSAIDIARKFAGKDFADFQAAVMQPNGKKIEASHKNFTIEDADLQKVKLYLDELAVKGPPSMGPTITQILIFIGLGLLMTLALLDLIFFRKIKYRFELPF